jgi:hypothetical protein
MALRFARKVCFPGYFNFILRPCVNFVCLNRLSMFVKAGEFVGG